MKTAFLTFMSALMIGLSGSAQTVTDNFKFYAHQIPQNLIAQGYSRIGALDFRQILQQMDQIHIESYPWVQTPEQDGAIRIFARWERRSDGTFIMVNEATWNRAGDDNSKTALAMHEVLGALGYNDENYNISTSLWLLSREQTKQILDRSEQKTVANQVKNLSSMNTGGVIGVGGGGDMIGPIIKINILEIALGKYQQEPSPENREIVFQNYIIGQAIKSIEGHWTDRNEQ
jgi:hypothetical protein